MKDFPGNGHINESWLRHIDEDEDPCLLVSSEVNNSTFRDAFLGNGYLGQRFPSIGEGSEYPTAREGLVAGLWSDNVLVNPPKWSGLSYHDGHSSFSPSIGTHNGYSQTLDLRCGLLTTSDSWTSATPLGETPRTTHIVTSTFLSRCKPNLACIRTCITPAFSGSISFSDSIDASSVTISAGTCPLVRVTSPTDEEFCPSENVTRGAVMALVCQLGVSKRTCSVATRVDVMGDVGPAAWFDEDAALVTREVKVTVEAGVTYCVTKYVVVDADSDDPGRLCVRMLATRHACDFDVELARSREAWDAVWQSRIEIGTRCTRVQKLVNAVLYQVYSSFRPGVWWSAGPVGLSGNSWNGRVFWDADVWVFPVLALLQPELATSIVKYRNRTLQGARLNAEQDEMQGACFAWESAETGEERVPPPYYVIHHQRHINSDVALAQWQYCSVTGDTRYLHDVAWPIIRESATYWASRVVHNAGKSRYEILQVFCADEYAGLQDNDCSTNHGAAWTLRLASSLAKRFGEPYPPEWDAIADKMYLPFDEENQRFVEYEGYDGQTIKQADAALMVYPYEISGVSDEVVRNTVQYYRSKYPKNKIMMSSAFDGIIDCALGDPQSAWSSFVDLLPHFRGPFLLVSEAPTNEIISFITGLGGLLQLIVMGFAGVRIHEDALVVQPALTEPIESITLLGAHYAGVAFDALVLPDKVTITPKQSGAKLPRIIDRAGRSWV